MKICAKCVFPLFKKQALTKSFSIIFFFRLPVKLTKQFFTEGSANTQKWNTYTELFKIETCSDSKVDDGGKEDDHWHHLLF